MRRSIATLHVLLLLQFPPTTPAALSPSLPLMINPCCAWCARCAQVGSLKRQLAETSSLDTGDLQRRLKEVTDLLYLKQVRA